MKYEIKPDEIRHCIHSISDNFFDISRLDGRRVLDDYALSFKQQRIYTKLKQGSALGQDVIIDGEPTDTTKKGYVRRTGAVFSTQNDNRYYGANFVECFDENKNPIAFSDKDDIGKLVILENGDVVGAIADNGTIKREGIDIPTTLVIPAVSFIVPPTEHVKHYARANFNLESILKGRKVLDKEVTGYVDRLVYLEGSDPDIHFEIEQTNKSVYFDNRKYDGNWVVYSHTKGDKDELAQLYKRNALMTDPDSIGKILLMRGNPYVDGTPTEEIVAGIVVGHEAKFNTCHGTWHATTRVCPANSFTLTG